MSDQTAKILVIDDDNSMLELTRINLEKLGFKVATTKNAQTGVELYKQQLDSEQAFDIVIIDLRLGGMQHGTGVATELLELHPDAKLIVSSGDSSNPAMVNFSEYGFKARLEKDFNRERMKNTIQQVLSTT